MIPGPSIIRFAEYVADLRSGELWRQGHRLKLQDKPFQVLAALLLRPGELVSREELRQSLWAADTFVDFEHGLNTAVNKVREALRDSANNPRFIETLPRRGYRFIIPKKRKLSYLPQQHRMRPPYRPPETPAQAKPESYLRRRGLQLADFFCSSKARIWFLMLLACII